MPQRCPPELVRLAVTKCTTSHAYHTPCIPTTFHSRNLDRDVCATHLHYTYHNNTHIQSTRTLHTIHRRVCYTHVLFTPYLDTYTTHMLNAHSPSHSPTALEQALGKDCGRGLKHLEAELSGRERAREGRRVASRAPMSVRADIGIE